MDAACTMQANIRLSKLNMYVFGILDIYQKSICRVTLEKVY